MNRLDTTTPRKADELRMLDAKLHTLLTGDETGWRFTGNEQNEMDVCVVGELDMRIGDKRGLVLPYTSDGNAMLTVINLMRERGYRLANLHERPDGTKGATFVHDKHPGGSANSGTFPEAVGLAAIDALEAEQRARKGEW